MKLSLAITPYVFKAVHNTNTSSNPRLVLDAKLQRASSSFLYNLNLAKNFTLPDVGLSKAPSIFNRVDLPLPEGPTTDTNSPLFAAKLTLFSDTTLPVEDAYTLVRFSTFIVTEAV